MPFSRPGLSVGQTLIKRPLGQPSRRPVDGFEFGGKTVERFYGVYRDDAGPRLLGKGGGRQTNERRCNKHCPCQ